MNTDTINEQFKKLRGPEPIKWSYPVFKDEKPVDWVDNKFTSVTELFPHWKTAEIMLTDFIKQTGDWNIVAQQGDLDIGLAFPLVRDLISYELVPMTETFPPEDRSKVKRICMDVMRDYTPILDWFHREKVTPTILEMLKCTISAWGHHIVRCGGRTVKDELAFRLGVGGGLAHIKFNFDYSKIEVPAIAHELQRIEGMTDEELIGYCDIHCETARALFSRSQINRMLELAGEEPIEGLPDFMTSHHGMAELVKKARERK